jgi:hypothetical protein
MKKFVQNAVLIILILFLFVSCNRIKLDNQEIDNEIIDYELTKDNKNLNDSKDNNTTYVEADLNKSNDDNITYIKTDKYILAQAIYKDYIETIPINDYGDWLRNHNIKYPQICALQGDDIDKTRDKQEYLNQLLFSGVVYNRGFLKEKVNSELNVDYNIMSADSKVISVRYLVDITYLGRTNSFCYTTTINLDEDRVMDLSEFIAIDENFINRIKSDDFSLIDNFKFLEEYGYYQFIDDFVKNYSEESHTHDFYITDNKLGIVIPIPHALGYMILEGDLN